MTTPKVLLQISKIDEGSLFLSIPTAEAITAQEALNAILVMKQYLLECGVDVKLINKVFIDGTAQRPTNN